MNFHTPSKKTVAAIGAMTAAIKAQHALAAAGISADVIALSPEQTRRGCAYGIEFSKADEKAARAALSAARIRPSQFIEKG